MLFKWIVFDYSLILLWRCTTISELMINEQIRDKEVRVVSENGEQLGIMSARDAMKLAQEAEVTDSGIVGLDAAKEFFGQFKSLSEADAEWK